MPLCANLYMVSLLSPFEGMTIKNSVWNRFRLAIREMRGKDRKMAETTARQRAYTYISILLRLFDTIF